MLVWKSFAYMKINSFACGPLRINMNLD